MNQQTTVNHDCDEIDLVDVIAFLWKIRIYLLMGMLVGAVLGAVYPRLKKAPEPSYVLDIPIYQTFAADSSTDAKGRVSVLNELVTNPKYTKIFVESMLVDLPELKLIWGEGDKALALFMAQQKNAGEALKFTVAPDEKGLMLLSKLPVNLPVDRWIAAVTTGLNKSIDVRNKNVATLIAKQNEKVQHSQLEALELKSKLYAIYVDLLRDATQRRVDVQHLFVSPMHFGSSKQGDDPFFNEVGERVIALSAALESTKVLGGDKLLEVKKELLEIRGRYESIGTKLNFVARQGGAEYVVDSIETSDVMGTATLADAPTSRLKKPLTTSILGLILGGFLGFMTGGLVVFMRGNWGRIKGAVQ